MLKNKNNFNVTKSQLKHILRLSVTCVEGEGGHEEAGGGGEEGQDAPQD